MLVTDLFQFVLKMSMIIVLAWVALAKIGGLDVLKVHLTEIANNTRAGGTRGGGSIEVFAGLSIWAGPPTPSGLCRCSRFWFTSACNGGWPGIRARNRAAADMWRSACSAPKTRRIRSAPRCGSTSLTMRCGRGHGSSPVWWRLAVYSPNGGIASQRRIRGRIRSKGYVMVLRDYLPPALRGLMVAAFLAAFMSTIGTQLNWGSSYLVNDFYKRFLVRKAARSTT